MSPWLYLTIAICLEVAATLFLKLSDGFNDWRWGSASILLYSMCFWVLAPALKVLPVGVVYALWAGLGILGASALGYVIFNERLMASQYLFIGFILVGAVGLRLTTQA